MVLHEARGECADFSYSTEEGRGVTGEGRVWGEEEGRGNPKDPKAFGQWGFSYPLKFVYVPGMEILPLRFDPSTWLSVYCGCLGLCVLGFCSVRRSEEPCLTSKPIRLGTKTADFGAGGCESE